MTNKLQRAFEVGGLGFEFCVFGAGALRNEWPSIIIIIIYKGISRLGP